MSASHSSAICLYAKWNRLWGEFAFFTFVVFAIKLTAAKDWTNANMLFLSTDLDLAEEYYVE